MKQRRAFTLVELLVVIGIMVVLISILIPVVGRVRQKAQETTTRAFIEQLAQAIEAYQRDNRQYPGPLHNDQIYSLNPFPPGNTFTTMVAATATGFAGGLDATKITASENMTLGILGGLTVNTATPQTLTYDPSMVGSGPSSLNTVGPKTKTKAYLDVKGLAWRNTPAGMTGKYEDEAGAANDSIIPEFVDLFNEAMPILYLRAKKGASLRAGPISDTNNVIVTYDPADAYRQGQYDLHQIIGYTGSSIGVGRKGEPSVGWTAATQHGLNAPINIDATRDKGVGAFKYPYDAYSYFRNGTLSSPAVNDPNYTNHSTPRNDIAVQKDAFILISAGIDRIYGTSDDITNFGGLK